MLLQRLWLAGGDKIWRPACRRREGVHREIERKGPRKERERGLGHEARKRDGEELLGLLKICINN